MIPTWSKCILHHNHEFWAYFNIQNAVFSQFFLKLTTVSYSFLEEGVGLWYSIFFFMLAGLLISNRYRKVICHFRGRQRLETLAREKLSKEYLLLSRCSHTMSALTSYVAQWICRVNQLVLDLVCQHYMHLRIFCKLYVGPMGCTSIGRS